MMSAQDNLSPQQFSLTCKNCERVIHARVGGQSWTHEQNASERCPVHGGRTAEPVDSQMKYLGDRASSLDDLVKIHHLTLTDSEGVVAYFRKRSSEENRG